MTKAVLLDEDFPGAVASGLGAAGHDVASVASLAAGLNDRSVLAMARAEQRRLLSFDGDFGELIFLHHAEPPPAVLFFRLHPIVTADVLDLALKALDQVSAGVFAVVMREGTRLRPFPMPTASVEATERPSKTTVASRHD